MQIPDFYIYISKKISGNDTAFNVKKDTCAKCVKLENGEPKQIAGFRTGIYSFRLSTAVAVICIIIDKIGNSTLHK